MAERLTEMETLFKALGDSTRLRILGLLLTGEVCVCNIHESLEIPQPKASRHLAYLRKAGLVVTRRDGIWIHYRLGQVRDPALAAIAEAVRDAVTHTAAVRKDVRRLQGRTNQCAPTPASATDVACCTPAPVAVTNLPLHVRRPRR